MLDFVEQQNFLRVASLEHDLHCGAITYLAGEKPFEIHWEQALELQSKVRAELFPWQQADGGRKSAYKRMHDAWERAYGSLSDPETQKKITAAVAKMNERSRRKRPNTKRGIGP